MPITNYPQGVASFGVPQMGPNPLLINPAGAVLFVNSATGSDNRGRVTFPGSNASSVTGGSTQGPQVDPTKPLATLAYALTFTKAARGDMVILMEGHTETLAADVALSNSGVTVYGCGQGDARPTFTTAGFVFNVTGTGVSIANIWAQMNTVATTAGVFVLAGLGGYLYNCKVSGSELTSVGIAASAPRVVIDTCEVDAVTTGLSSGILCNASARITIRNCNVYGIFASAPIGLNASGTTNFLIEGNYLRQQSASVDPVITGVVTASSGVISNNRFTSAHAGTPAAFIGGANVATNVLVFYLQNFGFTGKAGPSSGVLVPAVGTIP